MLTRPPSVNALLARSVCSKPLWPTVTENGALLTAAWSSVADLAVAPLQDVLQLGSDGRMNVPGSATGNWGWRFRADQLKRGHLDELAELSKAVLG